MNCEYEVQSVKIHACSTAEKEQLRRGAFRHFLKSESLFPLIADPSIYRSRSSRAELRVFWYRSVLHIACANITDLTLI